MARISTGRNATHEPGGKKEPAVKTARGRNVKTPTKKVLSDADEPISAPANEKDSAPLAAALRKAAAGEKDPALRDWLLKLAGGDQAAVKPSRRKKARRGKGKRLPAK